MRLPIITSLAALSGLGHGLALKTDKTWPSDNTTNNSTPAVLKLPQNITIEDLQENSFNLFRDFWEFEHVNNSEPGPRIARRGAELPPRDRKVADQMQYGLPECYQRCFRQENGKAGVNIYEWDLNKYCNMPGCILAEEWGYSHIFPCYERECRQESLETKQKGGKWTQASCGDFCKS